jgi:hypothetical protein
MLRTIAVLFSIALTCHASTTKKWQTLTDRLSGKKIRVQFIEVQKDSIRVLSARNKTYTMPLDRLNDESLATIEKWKQEIEKANDPSQINQVFNLPLFSAQNSLWNEDIKEVAARLKWKKESQTIYSSSFRNYPKKNIQVLNSRPYSMVIYGEKEKVTSLSLVFANKGDYASVVSGSGEDHFKELKDKKEKLAAILKVLDKKIQEDSAKIYESLTSILAEAVVQPFGEGNYRREVLRWDWKDHSILLSHVRGEFTSLEILPTKIADNDGKTLRVSDSEIKTIIDKNLVRKKNGDVFITNIPMVDQGPKGYCAPATLERAMRYMRVPADMYLLATHATKPGGGTHTKAMVHESKRLIRNKLRRVKDLNSAELKFNLVRRYINKATPILWQMKSLPIYNDTANSRTALRKKVKDFDLWRIQIEQEADDILKNNKQIHLNARFHISMIIGYNERTREVAVSDSWGPKYEIRWIHFDLAEAVSISNGSFVIER